MRDFENFLNMLMSSEIGHAIEAESDGWIVHVENEHYTSREDHFVAGVVFDANGRLSKVVPGSAHQPACAPGIRNTGVGHSY